MSGVAFCAQCGTPMSGRKFCVNCGVAAATMATPPEVRSVAPQQTMSTNTVSAQGTGSPNAALSIVSIILSCVSLLFFPYIFGTAALILAIIALVQKQRAAGVALGLSIGLPILGFIISFAVLSAVSY